MAIGEVVYNAAMGNKAGERPAGSGDHDERGPIPHLKLVMALLAYVLLWMAGIVRYLWLHPLPTRGRSVKCHRT